MDFHGSPRSPEPQSHTLCQRNVGNGVKQAKAGYVNLDKEVNLSKLNLLFDRLKKGGWGRLFIALNGVFAGQNTVWFMTHSRCSANFHLPSFTLLKRKPQVPKGITHARPSPQTRPEHLS